MISVTISIPVCMIGLSKDKEDAERRLAIEYLGRTVLEEAEFVAAEQKPIVNTLRSIANQDRFGNEML